VTTLLKAHKRHHLTGMVEIALLSVDEAPLIGQVYSVTRYIKIATAGEDALEVALGDYAEAMAPDDDPCCDTDWQECTEDFGGRFDRLDEITAQLRGPTGDES
jgi:hypothetical protein